MENTTFENFLAQKKIDYKRFLKYEPIVFSQWKQDYEQMHEDGFVMQKKFLINAIRRKYTITP